MNKIFKTFFCGKSVLIILALALCVSGCGFTPVYAPQAGADVPESLSQIQIDVIPDRAGQILRNELIDRLYPRGHDAKIRYRLSVALTQSTIGLSIARDATLTRSQTVVTGNIALTDLSKQKIVLKRTLSATSTYNVLPSQFGTLVTEQDSQERSLRALADQITTVLQLHFKDRQ